MKKRGYTKFLVMLATVLAIASAWWFASPVIPSYAQGGYGYAGGTAGGGGGTVSSGYTSLVGVTDSSGIVNTNTLVNSSDGKAGLTINKGTKVLDKYGSRLLSLMVTPVTVNPPLPPSNVSRIGLTYNIGPDGATFSPPVTITFKYDPANIPAGTAETSLVLAYFNDATGKWEALPSVVDATNNTISASISHTSKYAVMAGMVSVPPAAPPTPPAAPTTPPAAPTTPPAAPTTPAAPTPSAPATPTTPTAPIEPTPAPFNWLIVWIIGGVIVIGVVVWLIMRRQSA